ncbi:MAG: hypothetical protein IT426_20180 [Pirellulales bacterium]|nr:hypothetical protein [Pirellulales bacterium]
MDIIQAINDENLFRLYLGEDLDSWRNWFAALRVLYGLPILDSDCDVIEQCTGRDVDSVLENNYDTALFLTGRRSGKSRIAALIGAYEAVLSGKERKLSKGETGVVGIVAPTKWQAQVVKDYTLAIFETPLLQAQIENEDYGGFDLTNGNRVDIMAGDWRTVRGFTLLAAIVDEACFFGYDADCRVRSDSELVRAIKPSLATTRGKLICISSPYAMRGWCYTQYKKNFGNPNAKVLVWNSPSRTMNPTLPQDVVNEALAEDLASAKAEYLGEFRDDVAEYLPRSVIEQLVVKGRYELLPKNDLRYHAFVDLGGGRSDDAAVAIAHRQGRIVILDYVKVYKPPFNPHQVIGKITEELKRYWLRKVTGDNYAAEFVKGAFEAAGIRYDKADKNKSLLYAELIPRVCSNEIELLDNEMLVNQLASLERRTRSGGRDMIDHPPNSHDDLANVVAGVADIAFHRPIRIGAL